MIKDGINIQDNEICSFLLVGQSNMAGRGDFGEVSENTSEAWGIRERAPRLNSVLHRIAAEDVFCSIVPTQNLKPDGIHFDSASLRILGERYADAVMELTR